MTPQNQMIGSSPHSDLAGASRGLSFLWLSGSGILAPEMPPVRRTVRARLLPGDIICADSGDALQRGLIVKIEPHSGAQTVIASAGHLRVPFGLAIDRKGHIIVSDSGRLIRIAPETGLQTIIADQNSPGRLGFACGLAASHEGDILAANLREIVRVDPATGQSRSVSTGRGFSYALGVTVAGSGEAFVLNIASRPEIIRVNLYNGSQEVLPRGRQLRSPQAIAARGNSIYIADMPVAKSDPGAGRVIHVNARTGRQSVLSEGKHLTAPTAIAVDSDGQIIVGQACTAYGRRPSAVERGIIGIDPSTGAQSVISRGQGRLLNPHGMAVVPATLFP